MVVLFKYCVDVENCESFRDFVIYIYIYIYITIPKNNKSSEQHVLKHQYHKI